MTMENETKTCQSCGRELPLSDFSKAYKGLCKDCYAKLMQKKRAEKKQDDKTKHTRLIKVIMPRHSWDPKERCVRTGLFDLAFNPAEVITIVKALPEDDIYYETQKASIVTMKNGSHFYVANTVDELLNMINNAQD